jgi:hypothetical protein
MATTLDIKNADGTVVTEQAIINVPSATASTLLVLDSSKNATTTSAVVVKGNTLVFQLHAAPGTGNLAAGDLAIWFDQTDGAGKAMFQAKTANGTLVAAAVNLA